MALQRTVYTVAEITQRIKLVIEGSFPTLSVQGELSNFKLHSSGHIYFTLKDGSAQLCGVMWRSRAARLNFTPRDGMKVIITGRLTVYEARGQYQIDATSIVPLGVGELQIAFEQLKQKLAAEGLFDEERKKPIPQYPECVGIITSGSGAALQDILNILCRRFPCVKVVVAPVRVQGFGASEEIAWAVDDFNKAKCADVLIVGRGGGSLEDLWAFNEECVARAIARSRIPVVSAVGHEIDYTIADFVADLRAPTPSAAAELVVPDRLQILESLRNYWYTMHQSVLDQVHRQREAIGHLLNSYSFNKPLDRYRQFCQRVDELTRALSMVSAHTVTLAQTRHEALFRRLTALDPELTLKRGYAIVMKDGHIVPLRTGVNAGDEVKIRFADGTVRSRIEEEDRDTKERSGRTNV